MRAGAGGQAGERVVGWVGGCILAESYVRRFDPSHVARAVRVRAAVNMSISIEGTYCDSGNSGRSTRTTTLLLVAWLWLAGGTSPGQHPLKKAPPAWKDSELWG